MNKKIISVLLAITMLFIGTSLISFAATENIDGVRIISTNTTISSGETWNILPDAKLVIEEGSTLTVASGGTIVNHGTIENMGDLYVATGGILMKQQGSVIKHQVRLSSGEEGKYSVYRLSEGVPTSVEESPDYNADDLQMPYNYEKITETTKIWVNDGGVFCFRVVIDNPAYDINKFVVEAGGFPMTRAGTYFTIGDVNRSFSVEYGGGNEPYGEHLRKTIRIPLPGSAEQGYQAVALYRGAYYTEEVEVLYGDGFSFRIELDPAYSRSNYSVSIGIEKAEPTPDGVYLISNVTDEKAAAGMYEIIVNGVMSNETLDKFSNIFAFLKQIINTLLDIFRSFGDMFPGFALGE